MRVSVADKIRAGIYLGSSQTPYVAAGLSRSAVVVNLDNNQSIGKWRMPSDALSVKFTRGEVVACGCRDGEILLVEWKTNRESKTDVLGRVRFIDIRSSEKEMRDGSHIPALRATSSVCSLNWLSDCDQTIFSAAMNGSVSLC